VGGIVGDNERGVIWPLAVLFVLTLYGAATSLLFPGLQAPDIAGQVPEKWIGVWMLLAAVAAGLALYFPRFWAWKNGPDVTTISNNVAAIQTRLTAMQSTLDELKKTVATKDGLGATTEAIKAQVSAGGEVRTTLDAIRTQTDKIK
jgi:hypothetical protein